MSQPQSPLKAKRLRFAPLAIATGVLGAVLLSVSMSGTLSGFVASITNSTNTTATGSLVMQEQNSTATVTCLSTDAGSNSNTINTNASTCSSINKYGGSTTMIPGQTVTTSIGITNKGTVAANTFTLTPGTCSYGNNGTVNGSATDICSQMTVVIKNTTTAATLYSGTLAGLTSGGAITLPAQAAGALTNFSFAVTLPTTAGNTYQGLSVSQPLVWSFSS